MQEDNRYYPKVLIITVNPLSTTSNNGKTYASFFKGYPKDKIAQLYFHREIPSSDVCDNYYRISDEDVIYSITKRNKELGKRVNPTDYEERLIPEDINNRIKKFYILRFIRSIIWQFISFDKENLNKWISCFKPEIIFFCGGDANYLYDKVLQISSKYNLKIIYYITDDYILPYFSFNPLYIYTRAWTRRNFIKMCKNSALVYTIGDKMASVYKEKYGIESLKIMNLVCIKEDEKININQSKNDLSFVYTGGLHSNRWKTLLLIGKSFERLEKQGIKANLKIYSLNKPERRILGKINNGHFSCFCGALNDKEVETVLDEADVVVHVESFDKSSQKVCYLSISTKISEYMAKGKCILALGPETVASIQYIKETSSGYVISQTKEQIIDETMKDIILNPEKRKYYAEQALKIAKENHDIIKKREEFVENLVNLVD